MPMLRPWALSIAIQADRREPIYQQIFDSLVSEIERGRLRPGMALPGSRALAQQLRLNRNTVATAYEELIAQGWVVTEKARGTFVARQLPRLVTRAKSAPAAARPGTAASDTAVLKSAAARSPRPCGPQAIERRLPAPFNFADEGPDSRLAPDTEFQEAFRRTARNQLQSGWVFSDPRGAGSLRSSIAEMLRTRRGVLAEPESLLLTRGRQMGLYLCAQTLLTADSVVAVEQPGQVRVCETFRTAGARVVGVPVDEQGIQVDALRRLSQQFPIRMVYVTPGHQYPTTVTLSPQRRRELLLWAEETGAVILEEDLHHEYRYTDSQQLALASQDRHHSVVYLSSFSRMLLPGMNLGFISATDARIREMAQLRGLIDRQGEGAMELSVAHLMRSGKLQRRVTRTLGAYRDRRDLLCALLRDQFGELISVEAPETGGTVWLQPLPTVDTRVWSSAATALGVKFSPSAAYSLHESGLGGLRLSFSTMTSSELEQAVKLLGQAYPVRARLRDAS